MQTQATAAAAIPGPHPGEAESPFALLQRTFARQQAAVRASPAPSLAQRRERLMRLRRAIDGSRAELTQAVGDDFRKHPAEVEVSELHPVLGELLHAEKNLHRWMRARRVNGTLTLTGARCEVVREPKGVVLILGPWNYPINLLLTPLIAALAAGNRAILKGSEKVPRTSAVLARMLNAAFSEDEVRVFEGGADVGDALLALPFDHIFFTGSTRIGRRVMEAAARHLSSVTLELGGRSPAIVDASADIDAAAGRIAWGKLLNAGQTCVAPDHVYVHAAREREFLAALERAVAKMYGADEAARRASPDFARMVDDGAFRRVSSLLQDALAKGARPLFGGLTDAAERYIAPTALLQVPAEAKILQEEIFGPVLPVLSFEDEGELAARLRSQDKPLALYVFAQDAQATERWLAHTRAGGTCVNHTVVHLANPDLPFGGVGASGLGAYHGETGFLAFSHERSLLTQRGPSMTDLARPPYGTLLHAWVRRSLRWLE